MLNRSAIIVRAKQPFLEWLRQLPDPVRADLTLEEVNDELEKLGIQLHLSEVKGPVIDKLNSAEFPQHLSGQIFLSHYLAVQALDPEIYGLQPEVH